MSINALGQSHYLGLNPSNINWMKMESDKVRVIYLEGAENQAQRVVSLVDRMAEDTLFSLGSKIKKVDMILHNQTLYANGFVTVSPWRSELYAFGPQNNFSGATEWLDLLTIHEYRHIQQFQNSRRSVPGFFSVLFGQNGWGGATVVALPRWFLEGDAVFYETMATTAGRGRIPAFSNQYKAVLLDEDRKLGYEKAQAGSYKEFVPNHYGLGYFMVTGLRKRFGGEIWGKVYDESIEYDGLIYPLSKSVKRNAGMRTPQLFRETFSELEEKWTNEIEQKNLSASQDVPTEEKRTFTNYLNPTFLNDSLVIVEKSGYRDVAAYYSVNTRTGEENKLTEPGFYSEDNATISLADNKIIWSERTFDERWGNQDYLVLRSYDISTGRKEFHTANTKLFAPDFNSDGSKVIAVDYKTDDTQTLNIIDPETGNTLEEISHPDGLKFAFPVWDKEDIVVIGKIDNKNALFIYSVSDKKWEQVSPFFEEIISYPNPTENYIYFQGIFGGNDEIFALDRFTGSIYQVTITRFGATQPDISPDGKTLIYSEYTADGYKLAQLPLNVRSWNKVEFFQETTLDYFESIEGRPNIQEGSGKDYDPKPYNALSGLQFHSWSITVLPADISNLLAEVPSMGAILYFDDVTSTISSTVSAQYNANEERTSFNFNVEYGKLYPVLGLGITRANRNRYIPVYSEEDVILDGEEGRTASLNLLNQNWLEHKASFSVTIPWNLTTGNFPTQLWITGLYEQILVDYEFEELGQNGSFGATGIDISFSTRKRRALQHVNSRLGFVTSLKYRTTIGAVYNKSSYFQSGSYLYLPGVSRNHSFFVSAHFNSEPFEAAYKFPDEFIYPRGYSARAHDRISRYGVNYRFPLLYPDLGLGPVMFIQRVVANVFYDYSMYSVEGHNISDFTALTAVRNQGRFEEFENQLSSVGAEITFDFRFLRLADMNMGLRYSRLLDETGADANSFELIIISLGLEE